MHGWTPSPPQLLQATWVGGTELPLGGAWRGLGVLGPPPSSGNGDLRLLRFGWCESCPQHHVPRCPQSSGVRPTHLPPPSPAPGASGAGSRPGPARRQQRSHRAVITAPGVPRELHSTGDASSRVLAVPLSTGGRGVGGGWGAAGFGGAGWVPCTCGCMDRAPPHLRDAPAACTVRGGTTLLLSPSLVALWLLHPLL